MKKVFLLLLSSLLLFNVVNAQSIEKQVDNLLNLYMKDNMVGSSVLIAKKGEIIYHKGFGKADLENDVNVHPEHVFRIGSITKQFTACAILKLAEEGKLSLEDDFHKYVKDFPDKGKTITLEHLLTHTSGIKSYTSMPEWNPVI